MYSDSQGHIKINGKLSEAFRLLKGTEQGHPLSPELFKVYFKELSEQLNRATTNCPTLNGLTISHLAWADDLVILALDQKSLQKQLSIIEDYCKKWGLEINVSKTKYMVLNSTLKGAGDWRPAINNNKLELVDTYCYLGILISSKGKFTEATNALYKKALGALFGLWSTIDRRFIDPSSLDKLFRSLIQPIATYGCQVWLPTLPLTKQILKEVSTSGNLVNSLKKISSLPAEKVHLRHLKFLLGIGKKATNATAWGETGKLPLLIDCYKLCIKYFTRVINLPDSNFARAAMKEQISLGLPWFTNIKRLIEIFDPMRRSDYELSSLDYTNAGTMAALCSPNEIKIKLSETFTRSWQSYIDNSPKLEFFKSIKYSFAWEHYLDYSKSFNDRRYTAMIRTSSHRLNIETGRHRGLDRNERTCRHCLKSGNLVVEDEDHILHKCPLTEPARSKLISKIESLSCNFDLTRLNVARFDYEVNQPDEGSRPSLSDESKEIVQLSTRYINNAYNTMLKSKPG